MKNVWTAMLTGSIWIMAGPFLGEAMAQSAETPTPLQRPVPDSREEAARRPTTSHEYALRERHAKDLEEFRGGNALAAAIIVTVVVVGAVILLIWVILPWH